MMSNGSSPFQTFWMAGFECSDQLNAFGFRVDMIDETDHLNQIHADFRRLADFGIKVVREGIRWSRVERAPYHYDWNEVIQIIDAADRSGMQIVWDICHFGYPDDLTPLHPAFPRRFAKVCEAFASLYARLKPGESPIIVPINEVGFISWLGGEVRGTCPYFINQGWDVKYHLMKAYIKGVKGIRRVLPKARIMIVEPLINVTTDSGDPAVIEAARRTCDDQFQTIDILTGRLCPELGGRPEYIDIMGFNYYFNNQWDHESNRLLDWHPWAAEPKRKPLSQMLSEAHQRYGLPLAITETSHPKEDRPIWMDMIGLEIQEMLRAGLPLLGVCIYPIIDRPDWDYPGIWHHSGLWDNTVMDVPPVRVLQQPYAEALRQWQARIPGPQASPEPASVSAAEPAPVLTAAAVESGEPDLRDEPDQLSDIERVRARRRRSGARRGPGARRKGRGQRSAHGMRIQRYPVHFQNLPRLVLKSLQPQMQPIPFPIEAVNERLPGSESEEMEHAGMMDRD